MKQVPFPLYAKILLWFFLNLALLAAVLLLFFHAQFRIGADWLLNHQPNDRVQEVCEVITYELRKSPPAEWDGMLAGLGKAYQLQFFLFRNDGTKLAGAQVALPSEVEAELRGGGQFPPGGPGPGFRPPRHHPPFDIERKAPDQGFGRPDRRQPPPGLPGPFPKSLIHSRQPAGYWVLVRVPLPERFAPGRGTLVVRSDSLRVFFDYVPWLAVGGGAALFSVLFWLPLVRGITHGISQIARASERIAEGKFEVRVSERRRDELGRLAQAINRMAARLAGLVGGQKRFLGDVAHELCSPLARIQVALGILEQRADARQQPYVADLQEEVQHMSSLVNELLSFSKASLGAATLPLRPVRVREIAERAASREIRDDARVKLDVPEDLWAQADPDLLGRSLSNLLRNADRYAGHAGPITLDGRREAGTVLITVADCGPGVPEAELARIFDPFYRLDPARAAATGGVGLGLAIVKTCIESCQGTVTCRNRKPSGLEVSISLQQAACPAAERGSRNIVNRV